MRRTKITYADVPDYVKPPADRFDTAGNLGLFLTDKTGSCLRLWVGYIRAEDQRRLFGRVIGKGKIIIDGSQETVEMVVKVCFGTDYSTTFLKTWKDL